MVVDFKKYHGAGNDFIVIDERHQIWGFSREQIKFLCDRHRGIGADGLILLRSAEDYDFEMVYHNSDGLPGSMCGNGGRVAVAFAHSLTGGSEFLFLAYDGEHKGSILRTIDEQHELLVEVSLRPVSQWIIHNSHECYMDTGSPHHVVFVEEAGKADLALHGPRIRHLKQYAPRGVNVNFVSLADGKLHCRTYERGVEAETLSCGTGVTASAIAADLMLGLQSPVTIVTPGGELRVEFMKRENEYCQINLRGPARLVFEGHVQV